MGPEKIEIIDRGYKHISFLSESTGTSAPCVYNAAIRPVNSALQEDP